MPIPTDTLTFSASGLPPGLTISTGGLISGAPTTAGTYPVSISVFDGTVVDDRQPDLDGDRSRAAGAEPDA